MKQNLTTTNVAITRPKEVNNNLWIPKELDHIISVVHKPNLSSDDIIKMLRAASSEYLIGETDHASDLPTFSLEDAFEYIKNYRFTIKTKKVTFVPYWELLSTIKLPCKPFVPSVSKMYKNKTFLNKSMFNRNGLLQLFGDEYKIDPVKNQYSTDSYQIDAVIQLDEKGDDALKTYQILIQKYEPESTEIEIEDKF